MWPQTRTHVWKRVCARNRNLSNAFDMVDLRRMAPTSIASLEEAVRIADNTGSSPVPGDLDMSASSPPPFLQGENSSTIVLECNEIAKGFGRCIGKVRCKEKTHSYALDKVIDHNRRRCRLLARLVCLSRRSSPPSPPPLSPHHQPMSDHIHLSPSSSPSSSSSLSPSSSS